MSIRRRWSLVLWVLAASLAGCRSAGSYREEADHVAADIIHTGQTQALGRTEPFTIETPADTLRRRLIEAQDLPTAGAATQGSDRLERPKHWPEKELAPHLGGTCELDRCIDDNGVLRLTLIDALQVSAANSREYQSQKETVFRTALDLDLEDDAFRSTFTGALDTLFSVDTAPTVTGIEHTTSFDWSKKLKAGGAITAGLAIDLVKLLTGTRSSAFGITGDASITIPLLRGSGRHIVTEPLTQAQRDVIYAIWTFERFKKRTAVSVASEYLRVLQRLDQIKNAEDNYRRLIEASEREQARFEAGRSRLIDVDRTRQSMLQARQRWIAAQQSYASSLDGFKNTLGLPTDAKIDLDRSELPKLTEAAEKLLGGRLGEEAREQAADVAEEPPQPAKREMAQLTREGGGPLEMDPETGVKMGLERRLDLRVAEGQVYDAQRKVIVAADALRAGLDIGGSVAVGESRSLGSADAGDGDFRFSRGSYSALLSLDLPIERTSERNAYRNSFISLERAVRSAQETEDRVKLEVRDGLRSLATARESYIIQANAVRLAEKRVENTRMLLDAGRIEPVELLDAQADLINAQDALTGFLVEYRVTALGLQRDLSVLEVNEKGLWREYEPGRDDEK